MFGVIEIDSDSNKELQEKSGREGFRENIAYRQFKSILKNFFICLAADFFRETGSYSGLFFTTRDEIEKQDKVRKRREQNIRTKKESFQKALKSFFEKYDNSDFEKEGSNLIKGLQIQLSSIDHIEDNKEATKQLLFLEKEALRNLNILVDTYRITKPRIGLSKSILKDWTDYQNAFIDIENKTIQPIKDLIGSEISHRANKAKLELSRFIRIENALRELEYETNRQTKHESNETKVKLKNVSEEAKKAISESITNITNTISEVNAELQRSNVENLSDEDIVKKRMLLEERITKTKESEVGFLINLREQLESITFKNGISTLDQIEALEQRIILLEDQADFDLQLTQLGMAIEVVDHEFTSSVKSVRNSLKELEVWADLNEKLSPLYNAINKSFAYHITHCNKMSYIV